MQSNKQATIEFCKHLRTTLGPFGSDKIIHDTTSNELLVTNDGATLVNYLPFSEQIAFSPIHMLLTQTSKTQDSNIGDGTTSVVLFAGELCAHVTNYPRICEYVWQECMETCLEQLQLWKQKIPASKKSSILHFVATTSLNSKLLMGSAPCVKQLCERIAERKLNIQIMKQVAIVKGNAGGSVGDSAFFSNAILVPCKRPYGMPATAIKQVPVLVCRMEDFGISKPSIFGAKYSIKSFDMQEKITSLEREQVKATCKQIAHLFGVTAPSTSITGVLCNGLIIPPLAKDELQQYGIVAISNVAFEQVDLFARCLNATIVSSLTSKTAPVIASSVEWIDHYESQDVDGFLKIATESNFVGSLLLHAPTRFIMDECARSMNDVLRVLSTVMEHDFVVGGAGAMYMALAAHLQSQVDSHMLKGTRTGKEIQAIQAYIAALEGIPTILCENAGIDVVECMALLRQAYLVNSNTPSCHYGIDTLTGKVVPVLHSTFDSTECKMILEPSALMESIIRSGTTCAQMILRIDKNIYVAPNATAEELGMV